MRRVFRAFVGALVLLVVGLWGYGRWRSPEKATLDDAARAGAPGQFVALSPGITHYDIAGPDSGRTVVLVHGFSVPSYIWDSTAVGLTAAGYRVIRYDTYGRGWSDRPDTKYDGALTDRQLGELLDSLGVQGPVDLMGLSYGGFVTAHFTAGHPERVRTLTLVDPVARSEKSSVPTMLTLPLIGHWLWQTTVVPGMADRQLSDFLHPELHPTWVEQYRTQMRYRGFGRALLRTIVADTATDYPALYSAVGQTGVPVLLLWGRQDRTVPIAFSTVVRDAIPALRYEPIDSAGHLPHMEQASTVRAIMLDFLATHADSTAP